MTDLKSFFSLIAASISFALIGCSTEASENGNISLFDTKLEAEKAAKSFNCTGAHKMGDQWMPCKSHKAHEGHKKDGGHGNHHNH